MIAQGYRARTLETALSKATREFPAVTVTGPRQSGKSTTLRHVFRATHRYVSVEPPDIRAAATSDPRAFLARFAAPVIIDEIQYAPDLLAYIKEDIDARRSERGRYLLTGSQNLGLLAHINESLAGRTAILHMLPMSEREAASDPNRLLPWERPVGAGVTAASSPRAPLWDRLLRGGFPELVTEPDRDAALWHASYVQTYLERDVRALRQVGDLRHFQSFIRTLAARSGQLLNLTDIARDLGTAVNTAKAWLGVLEATFLVWVVRPYFVNIGKRLVRTPKVYFTDTGLLAHLVGLRDPLHAVSGPLAGPIFETAVVTEVLKVLLARGETPRLHFWRTASGSEVDLVVERDGRLIPIEMKTTATPRPAMAQSIRAMRADLGAVVSPGFVVHAGDVELPLGDGDTALPFDAL